MSEPRKARKGRRKNRQHGAKGASFLRLAENLREIAAAATDPDKADWINSVADAAAKTGKQVSGLR